MTTVLFKGVKSLFAHLKSQIIKLFAQFIKVIIWVNLQQPLLSLFLYGLLLSLWCFSTLVDYYFQVPFNLKFSSQCRD